PIVSCSSWHEIMPNPTPQQIITAALARLGGAAALNHPYPANDDAGSSYYALQMVVTHPTVGLIEGRYPFWVGARGRGVVAVGRTISRPPLGSLAAAIGAQLGSRAHPSLLLLLAATATHRAVPQAQQCRELGDITSYFVSYADPNHLDEPAW